MTDETTTDVIAAINAEFVSPRAYDITDPAVKALTTDHVLVLSVRRYVDERRASGEVTMPGGRVVTRFVAKTADNLAVLRAKTTAALEDQILPPNDLGPFVFESEDTPDTDEDWLVSTTYWTH